MIKFIVEHGTEPTESVVTNVEELDQVLDAAHRDAATDGMPSLVYIYTDATPDAPFLALGVGRDEFSSLAFGDAHVPGDLDGGTPPTWYYAGSHGELSPGRAVPVETAREAAREFVRTGQRPTGVSWSE